MGRRKRLHKAAVIAGTEAPFRTSLEKPKKLDVFSAYKKPKEKAKIIAVSPGGKPVVFEVDEEELKEPDASDRIADRIRKLKEQKGG